MWNRKFLREKMSEIADLLSFQLRAAKIEHKREVCLIPGRKYRSDIVAGNLAIECDGATWIGGRHSRGYGIETDCEKQNLLVAIGYIPMRVTRKQVNDGRALQWIERALRSNTGTIRATGRG
jgi:hypothetical protein